MGKTIRQLIVELLEQEQLSALDLSGELGVKEKEIFEHLEHIARSLKPAKRLVVEPAEGPRLGRRRRRLPDVRGAGGVFGQAVRRRRRHR